MSAELCDDPSCDACNLARAWEQWASKLEQDGVTPAIRGRQLRLKTALDDMATNDGYGEVEAFLTAWWKADDSEQQP